MSKSRAFTWAISVLVLANLGLTAGLWAQAPNSISYSGLLTDARGEPREGQFNLTFRIYDSLLGGTRLHEQAINNVVVRKGQFSVQLGPFPDNVFLQGSGDRYVEVQVGSDPPLLPRQQLASVPFALRAGSSTTGSTPWTAFPFASGYDNFADHGQPQWQRVQYRKTGDVVCLRGIVNYNPPGPSMPIPRGAVLGTLPTGFRPPAHVVYSMDGGRRIDVRSNGDVVFVLSIIDTQSSIAPLDGICFSTSP